MMNKKLLFGICSAITAFVCATIPIFCQKDSAKTYRFPQVEVEALRLIQKTAKAAMPTSAISKQELEISGARQSSDALSLIPGIFLKNYGGLGGMKTVSLRGTPAVQTLVLLDGARLNSSQTGMVDFSSISLLALDEVEVMRGGAATVFGAHSMGGVVNLRLKKPSNRTVFRVETQFGSFGEQGISGSCAFPISLSSDTLAFSFGGEFLHSDGDFPFTFNQFGSTQILHRENGDFQNISGFVRAFIPIFAWKISSDILLRSTKRGTPGAVVQGNIELSHARFDEEEAISIVRAETNFSSSLSLALIGTAKYSRSEYRDPDATVRGKNGVDEEFFGRDFSVSARMRKVGEHFVAELQSEFGLSFLDGAMLETSVGNAVQRRTGAFAGRIEREWVAENGSTFTAIAGLRADAFSDFGAAISPLAGITFSPENFALFRAQWAYNFRPPSFNELYYFNFGTSTLQPERSHSLNLGMTALLSQFFSVEGDAFVLLTENYIAAIPQSPVLWSAKNIGKTQSIGVEISATGFLWDSTLSLRAALTRQKASDETDGAQKGSDLVYVPRILFALGLQYFRGNFGFSGACNYSGERFSLPANMSESVLSQFFALNLSIGYRFRFDALAFWTRIVCENALGAEYAIVRNYPLPARSFRFHASAEW